MYLKSITLKPARTPRWGRLITLSLLALATAGLPGCDENDPTSTDLTTSSEGAQAGVSASVAADASAAASPTVSATAGMLPLPMYQSATSSEPLFYLVQKGGNASGRFRIDNTANTNPALLGETNGKGYAVQGIAYGTGIGGYFQSSSTSASDAVRGHTFGSGNAVHGVAVQNGRAGLFENTYHANSNSALAVRTMGPGTAGVFLAPNGGKGMFINSNSNTYTLEADNSGTGFAAKFFGYGSAKGVYIQTQGGAGLQVVGGSKNAVVATPSGSKALYTEESTEVWFTDYGFGRLANGRTRVLLDPSFAQTINPGEAYHVFLQARGRAEIYVGETTPLGFEVVLKDGDPNAEFSYRIVAKRLGFEQKRLEAAPWADRLSAQD